MKKFMVVSLAAVFAAGFAGAQNGVVMVGQAPSGSGSEAEVTAEVGLLSAHVWRGAVLNSDPVLQPQLSVAQYGVSFNVWANYNFSNGKSTGVDNEISEIDLSLAYTLPLNLNDVSFDVGYISYQFPANGDVSTPSTAELFASAYWLTFKDYVIPSVTLFGDVKEMDGTYVQFDVVAPYQISEYLRVEGGLYTGYGSARYNDFYFGHSQKGFTDYSIYGTVSYEILDGLTASFNLTYTGLFGGAVKENAKQFYEAGEKFWGGVNLAYDF